MNLALAATNNATSAYDVPGFMYAVLAIVLVAYGIIEYFHGRHDHVVKVNEAVRWSIFYVSIALLFTIPVYFFISQAAAAEYIAAWGIEKALSLDNLFVFGVIFAAFGVQDRYRHRILNYGIAGAIFFRLVFILAGFALLRNFAWVSVIFGLILIRAAYFAYRQARKGDKYKTGVDIFGTKSWKLISKFLPVHPEFKGNRLTTIVNGKRMLTMMAAVIIFVELTDIIFAIDSIPAVLAVTSSTYIAYASNVFAILGLRALYFVYDNVADKFWAVNWALAVILLWIGAKMIVAPFGIHTPTSLNLAVIFVALIAGVFASLLFVKPKLKN